MNILSPKTRQALRDSFQTFVLAAVLLIFAFLLSFIRDLAVKTGRPTWLTTGMEVVEVILFICDILVLFALVGRIVLKALKEFMDNA